MRASILFGATVCELLDSASSHTVDKNFHFLLFAIYFIGALIVSAIESKP